MKKNGEIVILSIDEVQYLEAYDDYVKVHTSQGMFLKKKTMQYYEQALSKSFVRIHRSFLVNLTQISAIDHSGMDKWEVRLKSGFHLQASKGGFALLKKRLHL